MKRLLLVLALVQAAGCAVRHSRVSYSAYPIAHETVPNELDGEWVTRNVYGSLEVVNERGHHTRSTGLTAVELVYCPIRKSADTVCRSTVVWEVGKNAYLEGMGKTR